MPPQPPDGSHEKPIIAIDPGRDKCGIAIVAITGDVILHRIYPRSQLQGVLPSLINEYFIKQIVLGHATTSQSLHKEIQAWLPQISIAVIDETGSTLEARALYWQEHPPHGWRRLTPLSLQIPPEPIDDFAAVVLARRYLKAG